VSARDRLVEDIAGHWVGSTEGFELNIEDAGTIADYLIKKGYRDTQPTVLAGDLLHLPQVLHGGALIDIPTTNELAAARKAYIEAVTEAAVRHTTSLNEQILSFLNDHPGWNPKTPEAPQ
jgi:hypothetical protein